MESSATKSSPASKPDRTDARTSHLAVAFFDLPRCLKCKSSALKVDGTTRRADEAVTRYLICRECGHRFIGIWGVWE
jgi:DNA-directed RNA polymerase subunit M/transcription elongation factor TFIIS